MYVPLSGSIGDDEAGKPTRVTLAMRPKPYLSLNRFDFDNSSLTIRLHSMVEALSKAVMRSWATSQPVTAIRLIGHTDSTGTEKYNIGLGDRRAHAVEEALRKKLSGLDRMKITVEPSPGESEPRADNGTREGRAINRRVEAFVTITPRPTPSKKKPVNLWDVKPLPDSVIRTKPNPYIQPIPGPRPGQSLSDWLEKKLNRLPSWLRTRMRDAILDGACGTLGMLAEQGGLTGPEKEAVQSLCRAAAKTPIR